MGEVRQRDREEAEREVRYVVDGTSARSAIAVPESVEAPKRAAMRYMAKQGDAARDGGKQKMTLGAGYVAFVAVMCAAALLACVRFLWLKEVVTTQRNSIAVQETKLTKLRSENDALLESLVNALDWEYIRDTATNRLGMHYAGEEQVEWYSTDGDGYVRQYRDVPEGY
ncbi:MAG: hypothetical protein ACSW75_01010 [Lachnospiraceae bacterium]